MSNETESYVTFNVETSLGETVELAVLSEFEFEGKFYVAAALVEGDEINADGVYIYKVKDNSEEFEVEKLRNKFEYDKVSRAYMEMMDSEMDEAE